MIGVDRRRLSMPGAHPGHVSNSPETDSVPLPEWRSQDEVASDPSLIGAVKLSTPESARRSRGCLGGINLCSTRSCPAGHRRAYPPPAASANKQIDKFKSRRVEGPPGQFSRRAFGFLARDYQ